MAQMPEEKKESDDSNGTLRDALIAVLNNATISDLNLSNKVIVLDAAVKPKEAIQVLIKNKIRAAPVVAMGEFIGVLDLRDTIKFALEQYRKKVASEEDVASESAQLWLTASPQITTGTLAYLAKMRTFTTVKTTDSVMAVAEELAKGHHIVGVIDVEKKKLTNVLTQGQLFQKVAAMWNEGPFQGDQAHSVLLSHLMASKFITSPVKTVRGSVKAAEAFELMAQYNLSGLAVVDDGGKLIHNTSASDIKLWLQSECQFDESIERFLIAIRKSSLDERVPVTTCILKDTFERAVSKLRATKYHRMWIVDDKKTPIGVLALTDIFKFLCNDEGKLMTPV